MLQNYNRYKILKVFLYNSTESFRLRELSRLSKLAPLSVMNYLKEFEKSGLIKKYKKRDIPFYQANRDNESFKLYQKISVLYELQVSGLVDYLWEKVHPEAIILYGSYTKGEAIEGSDIDIFILGKERSLDIKEFESKMNKKTHIIFEDNVKIISNELKNNLINGIVLKGYFKAF